MKWQLTILLLFLIGFVSATPSFYVEQNTNYTIKISCELQGGLCTSDASCNITINYPNSSLLINGSTMYNLGGGYYGYDLLDNETGTKGEHNTKVYCSNLGQNDTSTFTYLINPSGIAQNSERTAALTRGIWIFFIIGMLAMVAFLFTSQKLVIKWTFFGVALMFFLIAFNLLSIGIQEEVVNTRIEGFFDGFVVISWYTFYFVAFLLGIMWVISMFQTYIMKKNQAAFRKQGMVME